MPSWIKDFFKKENIVRNLRNVLLVLIGTFVVAVGNSFFLIPFSIVSGGVSGITILTAEFIPPDIMAYILNWVLFGVGLILLGLRFTISSLISTIFYPIFLSIFTRTPLVENFLNLLLGSEVNYELSNGVITNLVELANSGTVINGGFLLIIGLLGGMLVGVGCSITFHGGGSTGGLDILTFIISKFTGLKESIPFFILDGGVVLIGIILDLEDGNSIEIIGGLVGIISAFICSLMIEIVYNGQTGAYCVDIVTDKVDEVCKFSIEELDRSATILNVKGAYSKGEKQMVRIVFSRRDYTKVRNGIAKIDNKAFCTFYQTLFTGGEGFDKIEVHSTKKYLKFFKKTLEKEEKETESNNEVNNEQQ